ncbi:hypothetical protein [Paenibacillus roseipurpureus]|uniref:Uncharacterized protein n=1 Tax=Paenibacillus roseopurpureus TaxID=2918901 RepID=A0AA96LJZ4_9BACL|nr:hypothetical protein [Paenibacillus sp. MBLB1832]WNR42477.1 hypothetical protein MJB10_15215 [Paenibacillus sp. MBLB1832]
MEKRLTRTDYLFALMFIFMLVCILGAFFYGLRLGQTKSDQKYEKILHADKASSVPEVGAYDQQVLVSYYHTIFLPFREFQNKWFELLSQIELGNSSVDAAAVLKELYKVADDKYAILKSKNVPQTSPMLVQSHQGYLKSLKLFADALNSFQSKANSQSHTQLLDAIQKDAYFQEAKTQALTAQKNYFDSILAWNGTFDPDIEYFDSTKTANLDQWRAMNFNVKNVYITAKLLNNKAFSPFYPQDLTIRIDEFISSGQAKKLNVADVNQTMELLLSTNAVRTGDFVKGKAKWYGNEPLPQLPFFSDVN